MKEHPASEESFHETTGPAFERIRGREGTAFGDPGAASAVRGLCVRRPLPTLPHRCQHTKPRPVPQGHAELEVQGVAPSNQFCVSTHRHLAEVPPPPPNRQNNSPTFRRLCRSSPNPSCVSARPEMQSAALKGNACNCS